MKGQDYELYSLGYFTVGGIVTNQALAGKQIQQLGCERREKIIVEDLLIRIDSTIRHLQGTQSSEERKPNHSNNSNN